MTIAKISIQFESKHKTIRPDVTENCEYQHIVEALRTVILSSETNYR